MILIYRFIHTFQLWYMASRICPLHILIYTASGLVQLAEDETAIRASKPEAIRCCHPHVLLLSRLRHKVEVVSYIWLFEVESRRYYSLHGLSAHS